MNGPFIILSNHAVEYMDVGNQTFAFCQKSKKLVCVQKDMLEVVLGINLDQNENKTLENVYKMATDCIQYCKSNDEHVRSLYFEWCFKRQLNMNLIITSYTRVLNILVFGFLARRF